MKEYINEALEKYIEKSTYPWHMPGHKRQPEGGCGNSGQPPQNVDNFPKSAENFWDYVYAHDFTEAKDLDDMHEPEAFIADSLAEMKKVYGTYATYMLVNGSTSGLMTAIHAVCRRGDVLLMARNCHKAVYNAVCMRGIYPEYLIPEYVDVECHDDADSGLSIDREDPVKMESDILGGISADEVERKIEELAANGRKPRAVMITSPTYEGVISDIRKISDVVHRHGIYLIVDEAQGAHLRFMNGHETAMEQGADIVIESLHKTMPALTQTSLLHVMAPELDDRIRRYLQIFQTSSPSYIFMQSMEKAVAFGANNEQEFDRYRQRLDAFADRCRTLRNIQLFRPEKDGVAADYDEGRIVFVLRPGTCAQDGTAYTGVMLADALADRYGLIVEMASVSYVICISSVVDSEESYDILFNAIKEIDSGLCHGKDVLSHIDIVSKRAVFMVPGIAWDEKLETVPLEDAVGRVSGTFVYAYPPGIPVLAPGEVYDAQAVAGIAAMIDSGLHVAGVDSDGVNVLRNVYVEI